MTVELLAFWLRELGQILLRRSQAVYLQWVRLTNSGASVKPRQPQQDFKGRYSAALCRRQTEALHHPDSMQSANHDTTPKQTCAPNHSLSPAWEGFQGSAPNHCLSPATCLGRLPKITVAQNDFVWVVKTPPCCAGVYASPTRIPKYSHSKIKRQVLLLACRPPSALLPPCLATNIT